MMRHENKVTLIGLLSDSPREFFFADKDKTSVIKLKMITAETFLKDGKEVRYDTEHTIVCYDETKKEYLLHKAREGQPLFVEGKIKNRYNDGKFISEICVGKYSGNLVFLPPDSITVG